MFKNLLHSEKGSVMLEFCLVLPIYLLIFGGTFLIFDISMGKLHLQESNRNLAWLQDDRYNGSDNLINKELYKRATAFYDARNELEKKWEPMQDFWSFGVLEEVKDSSGKTVKDSEGNPVKEYHWGHRIEKFKDESVEIDFNNGWADSLRLSGVLDNEYMDFYSGNMYLKMDKVSAVYIGAVGISSVLFSDGNTVPLYKQAYILTRELAMKDNETVKDQAAAVNGEMLVLRRRKNETRNNVRNVNNLFWQNIIFRSWPSNGTLGDIGLFLMGLK